MLSGQGDYLAAWLPPTIKAVLTCTGSLHSQMVITLRDLLYYLQF